MAGGRATRARPDPLPRRHPRLPSKPATAGHSAHALGRASSTSVDHADGCRRRSASHGHVLRRSLMTTRRISLQEVIVTVLDPGTFRTWDDPPEQPDFGPEYAAQLTRAGERATGDEAVITGEALLGGRRVAIIVGDFDFLAGSLGSVASERITLAFERATAEGLPMLASPMSGGTRMQEGTPAFLQMIKIRQDVLAHRSAGLPYIV